MNGLGNTNQTFNMSAIDPKRTLNNFLLITLMLFAVACGNGNQVKEEKEYFQGTVLKIKSVFSKPGDQKIKSVFVSLTNGKEVNIFVEEDQLLENGELVHVYKYSDSAVYYLNRAE